MSLFSVHVDKGNVDVRDLQNSERSKVIQSISSVIQALPPDEEIPPIEVRLSSFDLVVVLGLI